MRNGYFNLLSHKVKYVLKLNLLVVFIFAFLYYIQDYLISNYPDFSEKYLLESNNDNDNDNDNDNHMTLKPFIYYLWFSLITQTTVGYTGIISQNNKRVSFNEIRSIPFKILNILQMTSIFIIPTTVL